MGGAGGRPSSLGVSGRLGGAARGGPGKFDRTTELESFVFDAVEEHDGHERTRRFVAGRTFYRHGEVWMDAKVAESPNAKRVKVVFASDAYFKLFDEHPRARAWLALGSKVQVFLGDTIYEIVPEG